MGFLIGFLTLVMVVDCAALIFLVLIQLPKKEAGAGLAFGGSATDALFGAGSGNVLTKVTKYAAGIFFLLAIVLAFMQKSYHGRNATQFEQGAASSPQSTPPAATMPASPMEQRPTVTTNAPSLPFLGGSNAPAKPAAEQPAPKAATTNAAPK